VIKGKLKRCGEMGGRSTYFKGVWDDGWGMGEGQDKGKRKRKRIEELRGRRMKVLTCISKTSPGWPRIAQDLRLTELRKARLGLAGCTVATSDRFGVVRQSGWSE